MNGAALFFNYYQNFIIQISKKLIFSAD